MASLFVKNALRVCPRAVPARTAFKLKPALAAWAQPSRCFSQSLRLLEKRYTESHEWVDVSADGKTCRVGITNHAAAELGDIVYVEVPELGHDLAAGEAFGSVESVKSASDLVSPVSGKVVAANDAIVEQPAELSRDPEGEGWLIEVEAADAAEVEGLMDEKAYAEFAANDQH
jgi:glycine cleavage system H protein